MAYQSGTATNYKDLLSILATFAAANGWVILEQTAEKVYLKGTGLAGLDEIYCGVETYEDPVNGRYNWSLVGSWGYRAGTPFNKQPQSSNELEANYVAGFFWNAAIPYWIVCSPRRIIVAAKVGTTYQMVHLGLLTPPATDAQYPYPLFLGGSLGGALTTLTNYNYSYTYLYSFWSSATSGLRGRLSMPGGVWGTEASGLQNPDNPYTMPGYLTSTYEGSMLLGLDDSYFLDPVVMYGSQTNFKCIHGTIDGLFRVTGYNNTPENIITIDAVNYIVLQDGSRSGYGDFCAMRLN